MSTYSWQSVGNIPSRSFTCWNCGTAVASDKGWSASASGAGANQAFICICHKCTRPTYVLANGYQVPGVAFGGEVSDVSDVSVKNLYDEARRATKERSYTAAVLCCRKLLMHIAVSKGAEPKLGFVEYVEFLAKKNFIPPDAQTWVDHIRKKGNEANHEIAIMGKDDAEELILFSEMLLKIIFEFPARIGRRALPETSSDS